MSDTLSAQIARQITEASRDVAKNAGRQAGGTADTLRRAAESATRVAGNAAATVSESKAGRDLVEAAKASAAAGPVLEVAKICGRAGVAGAVVDGGVGAINAFKYMQAGKIDRNQAIKHVAAESGCGFVTSSSGTAGTIAVYMLTGSMGPAAMAVGMGASIGSRWAYRKIVGPTLPDDDDTLEHEEDAVEESDVVEDIGPRPQE